MKNMILISLTISGLLSVGGSVLHEAEQTPTEAVHHASAEPHTAESIPLITAIEARDDESMAAPMLSVSADEQRPQLKTVNGLSLYDSRQAVIEKLGEPKSMTIDDIFPYLDIYEYRHMNVVFQDDIIYSIDIMGEVETLYIDDVPCPATIEGVTALFGEPDFTAEDGIVFQQDEALLKLYIDSETQELVSFSYYHIAMV